MSSDSTVQALEITDHGFTIAKQISRKGGEHIQVDLEITSTHDKQATVDLAESVPPGTDQSQIGFLPDNEPSEWSVSEDGRLGLQAKLVAQGTRQIVYGIRDIENADLETLATETRIVEVGGPAGADIEVETDSGETGDETTAERTEDTGPTDPAPADTGPDHGEAVTDGASAETAPGVVNGDIDDETAAELAEQLAPHLEDHIELDAVTETRLAQLQEDVSDIRGYLPAFEEFLGEAGRSDDILEELEELRAAVDEMDDAPAELESTIETMDERLATLESTAEEFGDTLEAVLDRLDDIETWREDIAAASQ